jgi:DNA-binding CsgD family transcriptional regulator
MSSLSSSSSPLPPTGPPPSPSTGASKPFLPPIDTPGLSPVERETLRVAQTLTTSDAIAALGLKPRTFRNRMNEIMEKYRSSQRKLVPAPVAGGQSRPAAFANRGYRRNV